MDYKEIQYHERSTKLLAAMAGCKLLENKSSFLMTIGLNSNKSFDVITGGFDNPEVIIQVLEDLLEEVKNNYETYKQKRQ